MAIDVTTTYLDHSARTFSGATGWHVDDAGYLHITKTGEGNLATFRAGSWVSVERVADTKANPTVINIHATEDPAVIAAAVSRASAKLAV